MRIYFIIYKHCIILIIFNSLSRRDLPKQAVGGPYAAAYLRAGPGRVRWAEEVQAGGGRGARAQACSRCCPRTTHSGRPGRFIQVTERMVFFAAIPDVIN